MSTEEQSTEQFDRYLELLGISLRQPSYEGLARLVYAHLTRVPFENVSKLYYRKRYGLRALPGLGRFLDGIEKYNFGGTCYTNNYYFNLLLKHLGYDARLCGADMAHPDVHLVSVVAVDGVDYLVDAGYAAPFLLPLPLNLPDDYEIFLGRDRYVLKPRDASGRCCMELHRDGKFKHRYMAKPEARDIREFEDVIAHSYTDDATFMNALLLVRFFPGRSVVVHNFELFEFEGRDWNSRPLDGVEEVVEAIEESFAIPRPVAAEAVGELTRFQDAWG
jgi:N-hydroxyarylamine O-acetyltransferase